MGILGSFLYNIISSADQNNFTPLFPICISLRFMERPDCKAMDGFSELILSPELLIMQHLGKLGTEEGMQLTHGSQ